MMISYISKIVGFSLLGAGAVGTSIAYGVSQLSTKIFPILLSEEDRKGQFLHELSKKVFDFLSKQKKLNADKKKHVVEWLKDKFSGSLENEDDKGENFKSLCEKQKTKENKPKPQTASMDNVNISESRLCFGDKGLGYENKTKMNADLDYEKGYLWGGYSDKNVSISNFLNGKGTNYLLGTYFHSKYPNSNPIDKFHEGYDEQTKDSNKTSEIKNILEKEQNKS